MLHKASFTACTMQGNRKWLVLMLLLTGLIHYETQPLPRSQYKRKQAYLWATLFNSQSECLDDNVLYLLQWSADQHLQDSPLKPSQL